MRSGANPYTNEAGLIDTYIGTAYENVKAVSEKLPEITHLSENMQAIYDFAAAKDAFEAFIQNPDFLQWLIDNEDTLGDLSGLLASLVQNYAPLAGASFTGFTQLGERGVALKHVHFTGNTPVVGSTNILEHEVNPSKVVGMQGVVYGLNGQIHTIDSRNEDVMIYLDNTYLRMAVSAESVNFGNRPFNVILTIIE